MEALRAYTTNNRGTIINVVYVVAILVGLYYLYKWLVSGSGAEKVLLDKEVDANVPQQFALPPGSTQLRVKRGGEYTLSFWMYITSWEGNAGLPKGVLRIKEGASDAYSLLTAVLYPNEPKMAIRVHHDSTTTSNDYLNKDVNLSATSTSTSPSPWPTTNNPMCDLVDIDLQRWINVTVSVNGRIVDIYYDGKLARSCVLPSLPIASDSKAQYVEIGFDPSGGRGFSGFAGKMSAIEFFAYSLTPDRIYSIYQAGPSGPAGLLGYIQDKLGIKIAYQA
jgi:hypothetical protein